MEKKKQAQSIFSIKTKRENQNEKLPKSANELIDRVLIVQSIDVFNANESYDKIFIAAGNVIERCLRFYLIATITGLKIEGTSLFDMIRLASKSPEFPQDFIDYFTFVRKKGNKRHEELEGAKEIDLWILKLDYYKFLKWFVCEYLKKRRT